MKNDDIIENVLQCGKEGVKQNIMEALDELELQQTFFMTT